ncbi:MAG: YlxR family protein, partial [Acidimicrobiia bacterium]
MLGRATGDRAMGTPRRTCVGCRRIAAPRELVSVRRAGDELAVGPGPGRGAWLCAEHPGACLDLAVKRGGLGRALRSEL